MILALALGCSPAVEAPSELTDLAAWLYRSQDEPEVLPEGLAQLDGWLAVHAGEEEGWALPPLTDDDVSEVAHPDRDLTAALGAVAEAPSTASFEGHTAFVMLPDQSVVNPDDYELFARDLLDGGECFPDACTVLTTWNDVIKNAAFGVTIPYEYGKDYRRVAYEVDGEERVALVSRGWVPLESFGDDGQNGILQSYTLDVFLDRGGEVHRVQAQWSEMALVLDLPDDYLVNQLISGLQAVFVDTDEAIASLAL